MSPTLTGSIANADIIFLAKLQKNENPLNPTYPHDIKKTQPFQNYVRSMYMPGITGLP
jgi:hypothetical protein